MGTNSVRSTSFVSLLLPLMMIARRRRHTASGEFDPLEELRIGGILNSSLKAVLDFEIVLIRAGLSLPLGGSLMLIAMKK